jgi:hypothetical protein
MSNTRLKHGEVGEEHNIHLTKAVSHCDLAICIKKYLKAKEELWKLKYFTIAKIYLIFKKSSKRNQNPSRYCNSITNLKFQHKPKYHFSKILIKKIDLLLPKGRQNPLSYYIHYNEYKHNVLALVGKSNKGEIF